MFIHPKQANLIVHEREPHSLQIHFDHGELGSGVLEFVPGTRQLDKSMGSWAIRFAADEAQAQNRSTASVRQPFGGVEVPRQHLYDLDQHKAAIISGVQRRNLPVPQATHQLHLVHDVPARQPQVPIETNLPLAA